MSEQTCKAKMAAGAITVDVHFDYEKAQPECGLGAEAVIHKVIVLNKGGFPMGDIIDAVSEDYLDYLQMKCFKHMGDS